MKNSPAHKTGETVQAPAPLGSPSGSAAALWKSVPNWLVQSPACVLLVLPFLLGLYFVHSYGVNVPWEDEWAYVLPLFQKWDAGTLSFWDFWAQHRTPNRVREDARSRSRPAFGWNLVLEMYVTQILLA